MFTTILANVPAIVQGICLFLSALVLFATVISKVTFWTSKDDDFVNSIGAKILSFLPTLGPDARTQKLIDMVNEMNAAKAQATAAPVAAATDVKAS